MSGRLSRRPFAGLARAADHDAVTAAVARVGLADRLRSPLAELSGGQQQRVLIARALAGDADLLVMDEPTSGVDHENQESLAELLGGLVNEGASVLLVAHELGPMRPLIDRALVLRDGQVDYDGPVSGVTYEEHEQVHHHTEPPEPRPEVPGRRGGVPMIELLDFDFMRRALVAAMFTGLAAPAIGTFLVQRRLALLGDGLGHVALTGVALGLLTGIAPLLMAVLVAAAGAVAHRAAAHVRAHQRRRRARDALLRRHRRRCPAHQPGRRGRREAEQLPVRVDHDRLRPATSGSSAASACSSSRWRSGSSPQLFAVCQDEEHARVERGSGARLQHPHRRAGRRHDHSRHAHGRAAAGVGADGRPGRHGPTADPQLPRHPPRRDGRRTAGRARRCGDQL